MATKNTHSMREWLDQVLGHLTCWLGLEEEEVIKIISGERETFIKLYEDGVSALEVDRHCSNFYCVEDEEEYDELVEYLTICRPMTKPKAKEFVKDYRYLVRDLFAEGESVHEMEKILPHFTKHNH